MISSSNPLPSALLVFACLLTLDSSTEARSQTPLTNNGYRLLVGIHKDVKEDPAIIDNLKDILKQASKRLYLATRNRARIESVSILLPSNWKHKASYEEVGKERFANADIVVQTPNKKYGDAPYTKGWTYNQG